MEDTAQIKNHIKKYIKTDKNLGKDIPEKYIGVQLQKIGGNSNNNYSVVIHDLSTNQNITQVLYRKFGALSDSVNHELETTIINYLAEKGYGPKIYYEVPGDYRISEFLEDTTTIPKEDSLNQQIIDKLSSILRIFTSISYTYRYVTNGDDISLTKVNDGIREKRIDVSKNQYQNCIVDWLKKARNVFKVFTDQFYQKYSKEKNPKECANVELVQHYLDNFKTYFFENFPSQGFLVLNHNDTHRLNILIRKKDQKLFLIDQEYSFLNLPGSDIINYLNECYFDYEPEYYCSLDKLNFDKAYVF